MQVGNQPAGYPGSFQDQILAVLQCPDPGQKIEKLGDLTDCSGTGYRHWETAVSIPVPGRPRRPVLVSPRELERRGLSSARGRACLVHAVAHIEFNAINLALDAAYRFGGMPQSYYQDWLSVAVDESRHFQMMERRLGELGFSYGDFPAHDGLWQMAQATQHSCLERMALVPRVLEARGLDVTPGMIQRLSQAGDLETVAALEVILREEVRHVEIGSRWFRFCCVRQKLNPDETFLRLVEEHFRGAIRKPLNIAARSQAGFSEVELASLGA